MPVRAKICGLTEPDTLAAAIAGGGSHVGFVFFPPSPRHLSFERATALASLVPNRIARVGVFVDPDDALVDATVAAGHLAVLQLHRSTPARAAALKRRTGLEIWAAVAVKTRADLALAAEFRGAADRILYDAKTPQDAALPGGLGVRFDWRLLADVDHPLPWALSGGLDVGNVAEAVATTGAQLVDVSSGVESASGVKDVDKITAFLQATARL